MVGSPALGWTLPERELVHTEEELVRDLHPSSSRISWHFTMFLVQEALTGSPRENCVCGWQGKAEVNFRCLPHSTLSL